MLFSRPRERFTWNKIYPVLLKNGAGFLFYIDILFVNMYNLSYSKSFMISDLVYNQFDKELILLYKDMDKITDKLKSVKALVIPEDLALKYTNMIDDEKMYYKEEK